MSPRPQHQQRDGGSGGGVAAAPVQRPAGQSLAVGYGLQLPSGYVPKDPATIKQPPQAPVQKPQEHQQQRAPIRKAPVKLTAEEKAARLAAMQDDAVAHDSKRYEAISHIVSVEKTELAAERAEEVRQAEDGDVEFMSKLNAKTMKGSVDALEDRIGQRAHYRQRGGEETGI
jgi:hypothetical protein